MRRALSEEGQNPRGGSGGSEVGVKLVMKLNHAVGTRGEAVVKW